MGITVVLADDHAMLRDVLRAAIDRQADMHVLAEAEDGREAVRLAHELMPDVIVLDVVMPHLNGFEAARQIVAEWPRAAIVALSASGDAQAVRRMLQAGARAYVTKSSSLEDVFRAIRAVAAQQTFLSPDVARLIVQDLCDPALDSPQGLDRLSEREREVLQLLAEGRNVKQIGTELHISPKTAESHRRNLMLKAGLHGTADLVRFAVREGVTSLDL